MLAVVAVVADHLVGWPHGGFVGVDVFFVISGYLITGLLMREFEARGSISFAGFYRRRIKRILPAALFVLLVTVAASHVLLTTSRFKSLIFDALASAFFVANWRFGAAQVDYFQQSLPPSPVQHYWSLAIEEQFYFFWPWLMLGLLVFGMRTNLWARDHARLVAGTTISVVSLVSFGWAMHESVANAALAYFSTFSRIWELGVGALVAIAATKLIRPLTWLSWLGCIGIAASYVAVSSSRDFPAPWALLPVVSAAAVLAASAANSSHPRLLTNPVSRYLGDISYSLYLWHFPVIVLLRTMLPGSTPTYWLVGAATTVLFSVATYHLLEQPARNSAWLRRDVGHTVSIPRGWLAFGLICALVAGSSAAASAALNIEHPRVLKEQRPVVGFDHTGANPNDCHGAAALDPGHRCASLNPASYVAPDPNTLTNDSGDMYRCYSYPGQPPIMCNYGSVDPKALRVAVTGDSHAAVLSAELRLQIDHAGWHLTTFVGNGCQLGIKNANCVGIDKIEDDLISKDFDVVIVTLRRSSHIPVAPLARALDRISASGKKVIVVEDNPTITGGLYDCINRIGFTPKSICEISERRAFSETEPLLSAAKRVPGATIIRTRDLYCSDGECPALIGNVFVYMDLDSHITATYSKTTSPYLVERIMRAIHPSATEAGGG
jgi:peptidoglycan/LPS O-acetylase OafA/YrhL